MESWVIVNFFIALSVGAIIGLEREIVYQKEKLNTFGGVRTFILIALFGYILTYLSLFIINSKALLIAGFAGFLVIIAFAYFITSTRTKKFGATSEIASIITFVLAAVLASSQDHSFRLIAIIATVITASLLAFKEKLHTFAKKIKMDEVFATIKMALISVVIIPLLPNKNYTLLDIPGIKELFIPGSKSYDFFLQLNVFNPFKIWLLVVFITGISFIGYFLVKLAGNKKGLGLTGFLGGFVSSTAVTVSMSKKSKKQKNINGFAVAILLASSMMFIRILIEVLVVNRSLISGVALPLGIMSIVGFIFSFFLFFKKTKKSEEQKVHLKNPFELKTAIKFALFFLLILVVSKSLFILIGEKGIYLVSIFAGLTDVDAITLTLSSLSFAGTISANTAILGITLAAATNTLIKAGIVRVIGEKRLSNLIMILFAIILAVGLTSAFIF